MFEERVSTIHIDPINIQSSNWANRHEMSFDSKEFRELKDEIQSKGGNVQPIKVRPTRGQTGKYEIVFGHRRHRACLELGLPVLAVIEDLDDVELFCQMDRENRQRAALRPYEQGMMYSKALNEGLFPSARKMAESVGADLSNLGKTLNLVRLPSQVINAFTSPLDMQLRWATELTRVSLRDPDFVLSTANAIKNEIPRPSALEVFRRLTAKCGSEPLPHVALQSSGRKEWGKLHDTYRLKEENRTNKFE